MNRFLLIVFVGCLAFGTTATVYAQEGAADIDSFIAVDGAGHTEAVVASTSGREFWLALPPVLSAEREGNASRFEIHVTSEFETTVTLELAYSVNSRRFTKEVTPEKPAIFSSRQNEIQWEDEIFSTEIERVMTKGILVSSDFPINVHVYSSKNQSTDGFHVLPAHVLGTDYMHLGYYNYNSSFLGDEGRGSGFVIVATEDNTTVEFTLSGRGIGRSHKYKRIGDPATKIVLQRGQVYALRTHVDSSESFDISGTRISSDNPIALLSFHSESIVPLASQSVTPSYMVEMLPPVSSWGTNFVTRRFGNGATEEGDYFRLLAAEDSTVYKVHVYNELTGELIWQSSSILQRAGDWKEFAEVDPETSGVALIGGISVWETNKPVLLMQYGISSQQRAISPFTVTIPPIKQYIQGSASFYVPPGLGTIHLFAIDDSEDDNKELLQSVSINGQSIQKQVSGFITNNRAPGTNVFWAAIPVDGDRTYSLSSKAKIAMYLYGGTATGHYGVPLFSSAFKIDQLDTLAPQLFKNVVCGDVQVIATEQRNGRQTDEFPQIDQGIALIELDPTFLSNFSLSLLTRPRVQPHKKEGRFEFTLNVVDKLRDGWAAYSVTDRAGNRIVDTVWYTTTGESVVTDRPVLDYGTVRKGEKARDTIVLHNTGINLLTIDEIYLKSNNRRLFLLDALPSKIVIPPGQTFNVPIEYQPLRASNQSDRDSLFASTYCNTFPLAELRGRGIIAQAITEDIDFGEVYLDETVCLDEGIRVCNNGEDTLVVTGISLLDEQNNLSQFIFKNKTIEGGLPVSIAEGECHYFNVACFRPSELGEQLLSVTIYTLHGEGDRSSHWRGVGVRKPIATSVDGGEWRAGEVLAQNQPNPARTLTRIRYRVEAPGKLTLELFDYLGRSVTTVVDEAFHMPGEYTVELPVANLRAGVYYYRLHTAGQSSLRSMVVR